MSGKQWLTIEDWFDCEQPLCPLDIRHGGRIERTKPDFVQTVFVSSKLGARVLYDGESQVDFCCGCWFFRLHLTYLLQTLLVDKP